MNEEATVWDEVGCVETLSLDTSANHGAVRVFQSGGCRTGVE